MLYWKSHRKNDEHKIFQRISYGFSVQSPFSTGFSLWFSLWILSDGSGSAAADRSSEKWRSGRGGDHMISMGFFMGFQWGEKIGFHRV